MHGIIISLLILSALLLLFIQTVELRLLLEEGRGRIEIDYSLLTVVINKDTQKKKKRKNRLKKAVAMLKPARFLIKNCSLTVRRIDLPINGAEPSSAVLKDRLFRSLLLSSLSYISFIPNELSVYREAISTTRTENEPFEPTVDLAVKCRLYHIFFSGIIFMIEYIKRNDKNGREQNE